MQQLKGILQIGFFLIYKRINKLNYVFNNYLKDN